MRETPSAGSGRVSGFPYPLRLPVFAAPMYLVSGPDMVIAACRSGIGGAFPTPNCRTVDELEQWMDHITRALSPGDGPWVANVITHSTNARLGEDLRLVERYRPPVVITALGSPGPVMGIVKGYGGLVFADVVTVELARKAAALGVDGLACVSAGAGGHTGFLSPFAFISAVREFFAGFVAVGGGIADGVSLAGAIAAGADVAYVGTRFLATAESLAQPEYKRMVIECGLGDLVVSAGVTGTPASWLRPSLRAAGLDPDAAAEVIQRDYSGGNEKRWRDIWAAGQGLGAVRTPESVAEVVDRLEWEYERAATRFHSLTARRDRSP